MDGVAMCDEHQQVFWPEAQPAARPSKAGRAEVTYRAASSILTPASGFMAEYDYTLNPYSGCGFGCHYCYAAFFARDKELVDTWGDWVTVKENAVDLLRRRRKSISGKSIYMSSVTDPYQPIERKLELVRSILSELIPHQPRLVVQTRSPLVTRDIDLLKQFDVVRVNMTVTTDSEEVRRAFEPHCPTNNKRLEAIAEVMAAGIDSAITLTPLLPVDDPPAFAQLLASTGVNRFVVQPFHPSQGRFVRGTREEAVRIASSMGWNEERYRATVEILRKWLPDVEEGQDGFAPP